MTAVIAPTIDFVFFIVSLLMCVCDAFGEWFAPSREGTTELPGWVAVESMQIISDAGWKVYREFSRYFGPD